MSFVGFLASLLYSQFFVTPVYPTDSYKDKTAIVTGANTGLGLEAARHFVRLGASKVILAVRSQEKGQAAKEKIIASEKCTKDTVEVWSLDLQSFDSVKAFAERCKSLDRVDALVENAGVATENFRLAEGHESTITTNVISTFLLALLMTPILKETARKYSTRPHLVIVSSEVHFLAPSVAQKDRPIFQALDDPKTSNMSARYPVSKLLEVYAVREIAKQYMSDDGHPIIINCVNPGFCHSELTRETGFGMVILKAVLARTTEKGSRTLVHAASAGEASHGQYLSDCKPTQVAQSVIGPQGAETQKQVWSELSAILEAIQPGIVKNL